MNFLVSLNKNANFWKDRFYSWHRLFDSPNIRNFLKEEKKSDYDRMIREGKFKGKEITDIYEFIQILIDLN